MHKSMLAFAHAATILILHVSNMPFYKISLGKDKFPAAMLNWIQNGPDHKGKYHPFKKIQSKVHL